MCEILQTRKSVGAAKIGRIFCPEVLETCTASKTQNVDSAGHAHKVLYVSPGLPQVLLNLGTTGTKGARDDDRRPPGDAIRVLPLLFQGHIQLIH